MTAVRKRQLIAWYEILSGALFAAAALSMLIFSATHLQELAQWLLGGERMEDPSDPLVHVIEALLPSVLHGKQLIGWILLVHGALKLIGGIGFLNGRVWGASLLLAVFAILLPYDAARLAIHPSLWLAVLFLVNLVIVFTLVRYRRAFLHV